jgi:hypothetical protein
LLEFKKSLEDQVASAYNAVEQGIVEMYERNSKLVQEKVQELFVILDRIGTVSLAISMRPVNAISCRFHYSQARGRDASVQECSRDALQRCARTLNIFQRQDTVNGLP